RRRSLRAPGPRDVARDGPQHAGRVSVPRGGTARCAVVVSPVAVPLPNVGTSPALCLRGKPCRPAGDPVHDDTRGATPIGGPPGSGRARGVARVRSEVIIRRRLNTV